MFPFLQHLQLTKNGKNIDYYVTGMANIINPSKSHASRVPSGSLKFHTADKDTDGGFLYAETTAKNMTLTFIDAHGRNLYTNVIFPRVL